MYVHRFKQFCKLFSENYDFKPSSKGQAPEITAPLSNQFGNSSDVITFECEIAGEPRPEIQWFRGSKELFDTPKWTLINKGAKQVLIIGNLHAEDEDEYTCRATNEFGSRSTRAQLKLGCEFVCSFVCFWVVCIFGFCWLTYPYNSRS